jgi:hypothetical protein
MSEIELGHMTDADWSAVADLICVSTNTWYQVNRGFQIFTMARVFILVRTGAPGK